MRDTDRYKLHHGSYVPPRCRVGGEYRGREVVSGGISDAPIQWPYRKSVGRPSYIVCGDLIRAVQTEAEIAVAHHWGVSPATVENWRRALDVPRMTEGTRRLAVAYTPEKLTDEVHVQARAGMERSEVRVKIRESRVGKPLHHNMIAAQREVVRRLKSDDWKRGMSRMMQEVW